MEWAPMELEVSSEPPKLTLYFRVSDARRDESEAPGA
jgi:hypothetical protein